MKRKHQFLYANEPKRFVNENNFDQKENYYEEEDIQIRLENEERKYSNFNRNNIGQNFTHNLLSKNEFGQINEFTQANKIFNNNSGINNIMNKNNINNTFNKNNNLNTLEDIFFTDKKPNSNFNINYSNMNTNFITTINKNNIYNNDEILYNTSTFSNQNHRIYQPDFSECNYFDIENDSNIISNVNKIKPIINRQVTDNILRELNEMSDLTSLPNPEYNISPIPAKDVINLKSNNSILTFKGDTHTNNSTINKIAIGVNSSNERSLNLSYSNSNVKVMNNFYPVKKNIMSENENKLFKRDIRENKEITKVITNKKEPELSFIDDFEIGNLEEMFKDEFKEEFDQIVEENRIYNNNINNINNSNNYNVTNKPFTQTNNQINKNFTNHLSDSPILYFPLNKIIKHKLNPVQENCFDLLYNTDQNSVISSPTGSGKTLLLEIAIGRIINKFYNRELNKFSSTNFKIVYLAPIKSLCQEKFMDWKLKFGQSPFALSVIEATGDSDYINTHQLTTANIIFTTPERWDIITRKWKDNPHLISSLVLFLIDEVHLLNDETRGATLEAIVARMKLLAALPQFSKSYLKDFRTIALSATIPNIKELAEFLKVDFHIGMKNFGEEYRPVQIEKLVFGYNNAKNEYMFEKYLNYRLADLIMKYSDNRPSLVFCQTQKGTISAASQLVQDIAKLNFTISKNDRQELNQISSKIRDKVLFNLVRNGIAFHNASLCGEDRHLVEDTFKKGLIRVICTTSTLAQGVNLPARLVIIKSTYCYRGPKVGYNEYSKMEIDQMIGRAGRPQFDTKGIAIIMTEKTCVDRFNEITNEKQEIESHLKDHIIEHINAEITQGTIIDVESAINWLKSTFMYIRMKNHPEKFNIRKTFNMNIVKLIDDYLLNMCVKFFNDLKDVQLISVDSKDSINSCEINCNDRLSVTSNFKATATSLGKKMSKNYVFFQTLKSIVNMTGNSEEVILDVLSNSFEFSKYHSKMEDRKILNQFNKEEVSIKYKIKGPVDTPNKKVFVLLQASLSGFNIDQWELRRQQTEILNQSGRILNCIKEYFKFKNDGKGYINSIFIKKALNQKMWSDSDLLMKQLPKIGDKIARNFVRAGMNNFEKIVNENPRKIEAICGKNAPIGNILIDLIKSIPTIEFKYEIVKNFKNTFKFQMIFALNWRKFTTQEDFDPYTTYHCVVIESLTNSILFKKKLKPSYNNKNLFFNVPNMTYNNFPVQVYLISDKFFGFDKIHSIQNPQDKIGTLISQGVSCTGQILIYQMMPNNKNVIEEGIDLEVKEMIKEYEDESNKINQQLIVKKRENKKKKEQVNSNIKEMIEQMKISDTGNNKKEEKSSSFSNMSNSNENYNLNNVIKVNNFNETLIKKNENLKDLKTDFKSNSNYQTEKSQNRNFSFIENFADNKNIKTERSVVTQLDFSKEEFNIKNNKNISNNINNNIRVKYESSQFTQIKLDFLDSYKYDDSTKIEKAPVKTNNSLFNFEDIL